MDRFLPFYALLMYLESFHIVKDESMKCLLLRGHVEGHRGRGFLITTNTIHLIGILPFVFGNHPLPKMSKLVYLFIVRELNICGAGIFSCLLLPWLWGRGSRTSRARFHLPDDNAKIDKNKRTDNS